MSVYEVHRSKKLALVSDISERITALIDARNMSAADLGSASVVIYDNRFMRH
jgi:hypothetical protein